MPKSNFFCYKCLSVMLVIVMFLVTITNISSFSINTYATDINEDLYVIESALCTNKVLDIKDRSTSNKSNCQLYERNNTAAQVFRVIPIGEGYYIIQLAMTDDKVLEISDNKGYNGCNVQIYSYNGADSQLWSFESAGSGYYYIKSKTGYYLDVTDGKLDNGTNLQVYVKNQSNANYQKFKLIQNYSVSKATDYAQKYTDSSASMQGIYNDRYNIYHNNEWNKYSKYKGFDCANFGSQCIFEGGFVATDQWSPVYRGEDYKGNTAQTTWVSAKDLCSYMKSLGYPVQKIKSDLSNIHKGDIVFMTSGGEGKHTTICTGFEEGKPVYCAHSCWRKNYPYKYSDFEDGYVIDMSFSTCNKIITRYSHTESNSSSEIFTYTINSNSGAKVRSGAGISYEQKGGISKGSVVSYDRIEYNDGYTWYHIVSVEAKSGSWGSYSGYWVANV